MVITAVRFRGEGPLRVTSQELRHAQNTFMMEFLQRFVAKAGPLLIEADGDLTSPAGAELQVSQNAGSTESGVRVNTKPAFWVWGFWIWGTPWQQGSRRAGLQAGNPGFRLLRDVHLFLVASGDRSLMPDGPEQLGAAARSQPSWSLGGVV